MRVYYHDNLPGDCRLPHISTTTTTTPCLTSLGLLHHSLHSEEGVDQIAQERGYKNRDIVTISPTSFSSREAYNQKLAIFFQEHLHDDEEIRWILDGEGYFDVRDQQDRWVRLQVEKGDLVVLPRGSFHRFTVGTGDYIKAMRLFQDQPKWEALTRSEEIESSEAHEEYIRTTEQNKQIGTATSHAESVAVA